VASLKKVDMLDMLLLVVLSGKKLIDSSRFGLCLFCSSPVKSLFDSSYLKLVLLSSFIG
jgi:hypothetical protein